MPVLRPLLATQLSLDIASLADRQPDDVVVCCEVLAETDHVPHHRQKLIFLFSAMRHFAQKLQSMGIVVHYVRLDDKDNTQDLVSEFKRLQAMYHCSQVVLTAPGEFRMLEAFKAAFFEVREDSRFLSSPSEFKRWALGKKQLRMEYFYQMMRKKHQILLNTDGTPCGGQWNFDASNREPLKKVPHFPPRTRFEPDAITREVIDLVGAHFPTRFGDIDDFCYAVTQEDALLCLHDFLEHALPYFGLYQDVMVADEAFLYHSIISMYLNVGLLCPKAVCMAAIKRYELGLAPIEAVEGFVRQILGWREYVRGIYWLHMPNYQELNALDAHRPLPALYWGAPTKMNCMKHVVNLTKQYAYSHHIQRLMVTGNFALLTGIAPKEVCAWYLAVYLDADEWVEMPNTLGMALFADGGIMASKPYAASGRYIHKMSNFCKKCDYDVKDLLGERACPFNALYWRFIAKNEAILKTNPRLSFVYANWRKFNVDKQRQILEKAQIYLDLLAQNNL